MKIGMADSTNFKFCRELKHHWEKKHEVRAEIGASELIAQWADLYYIDWYDNNIFYLFNWYKEHPEARKPKFVVRVIDIDFWARGVKDQAMVDFVDYWIFIAPHIGKHLLEEIDNTTGISIDWKEKLYLIRPGVNLTKYPMKQGKTDAYQIGMVLGDMWWYKNHMAGLDIFADLVQSDKNYYLHIRGQHEPGQYNPLMYNHFLESRGIKDKVTLHPWVDDMNEFYEKIDILLHPGMKEAFCYAAAEAMAKGIKVVMNNFYGAEGIWDKDFLYNTHDEAIALIESNVYDPVYYQNWIKEHYSLQKQLKEINELLGC